MTIAGTKRLALFASGAALALLLGAPFASAAEAQTASTTTSGTATAIVVANLNFGGVIAQFATSTRTVSVQAIVTNSMGDASNESFGLEVVGKDGFDAAFLPQRFSIRENGALQQSASIQIPAELSGDVAVHAVVATAGGVIVADQLAWSGKVASGASASPLTCSQTKFDTASCSVSKGNYTLAYRIFQNDLGGTELLPVNLPNAGGQVYAIPVPQAPLPSGNYAIVLHVLDSRQNVIASRLIRISIPGTSGSISTYVIESRNDGSYFITLTSRALIVGTSTVPITLSFQPEMNGQPCGSPTVVAASSSVTQLSIRPTCAATAVLATLSAGGKTLDSAMAVIFPKPAMWATWGWPAGIILLVLVILGLISYIIRRRKPMPPPASTPPPPASPVTYP